MTIKVRCHPEQMRRSCTRGEENGKKIKAISCKLTILLRFKSFVMREKRSFCIICLLRNRCVEGGLIVCVAD